MYVSDAGPQLLCRAVRQTGSLCGVRVHDLHMREAHVRQRRALCLHPLRIVVCRMVLRRLELPAVYMRAWGHVVARLQWAYLRQRLRYGARAHQGPHTKRIRNACEELRGARKNSQRDGLGA